jgi:hypothetical protein
VHAIDNLDVIEVNELLGHGDFSLSGWLHEALRGLASAWNLIINAAISGFAIHTLCVAASLSCNSTTPDNIKAVIQDGDVHYLRSPGIQLEIMVIRDRVREEALANGSSLDAFRAIEAIAITSAFRVSWGSTTSN